jgi:hypothetical protein
MDCNEFITRYSDYDDSHVPSSEHGQFRAHLESCAACARYDRVLRKGRMAARQLRVEPSDDFVLRLDQRLWRESHRSRSRLRRPARVAAALAALTVLLAVTAAVGILGGDPVRRVPTVAGAAGGSLALEAVPAPPAGVRVAADRDRAGEAGTRVRTLPPALAEGAPRAWSAERVAPAASRSYSPLVVGPPAYRAAAPSIPVHTLD